MSDWKGPEYDLLHHNCVFFSDAFCKELGVGAIPVWVTNLAGAGATIQDGAKTAADQAQAAAIIAAAKAGEIDEKYKIKAKAGEAWSKTETQAKIAYAQASAKYKELDEQYKINDKAKEAASKTQAQAALLAMQASAKAAELDQQYKIQETALNKANQAWAKILEVDNKYRVKEQANAMLNKGLDKVRAATQGANAPGEP